MNIKKLKRILLVAITVSASSLVSFNIVTTGFIVSLSVLVMGIFIYCYRDMRGHHIAWLVAVCSPFFRWIVLVGENGFSLDTIAMIVPDSFFFLAYGAVYAILHKYIVKGECRLNNFFFVAFFCDWTGNICELMVRSVIYREMIMSSEYFLLFGLIALCRTGLVQFISASIEYYTSFLLSQERDEMFKKLLNQASVFESEVRVMEKNIGEIEVVMRKAYDLHNAPENSGISRETRGKLLEIAKSAHEIKGDYMAVLSTLKDVYINELKGEKMLISEVISLEKQNVISLGRSRGCTVSVNVKIKADFDLDSPFKLMSVIRNIFTNSLEAVKNNSVTIGVTVESDKENPDVCKMTFTDNGCGIEEENLEFIRMEGYSTKFSQETGNIQRGLGLPVVWDIIENEYKGKIDVQSTVNRGTTVTIRIPTESIGERAL